MSFNTAEEAFINAAQPVILAGEAQREAYEVLLVAAQEFQRVEAIAEEVGLGLGEEGQDVEYVHGLMLEAATRAGFDADSRVVEGLNAGLQEYHDHMAAVDEAAARNNAEAAGIVLP